MHVDLLHHLKKNTTFNTPLDFTTKLEPETKQKQKIEKYLTSNPMAYQIQIESAAPLPLKQKNKFINQLKILKMLPKKDPHKILA